MEEVDHLHDPDHVRIIQGSARAIREARKAGFIIVMVSNQSGVARGYFKEKDVEKVNERMHQLLGKAGGYIDGFYFCPHHLDGKIKEYKVACDCRKPATGMLRKAVSDFGIDLSKSFMVGDKSIDIEMGKKAGIRTVLVRTGYGESELARNFVDPDFVADDLLEAVKWIRKSAAGKPKRKAN